MKIIDSKNSQMIVVIGVMVTLQSTFFIHLLVEKILVNVHVDLSWKIFLSVVMVLSLILYVITMYIFIKAYAFDDAMYVLDRLTTGTLAHNLPNVKTKLERLMVAYLEESENLRIANREIRKLKKELSK